MSSVSHLSYKWNFSFFAFSGSCLWSWNHWVLFLRSNPRPNLLPNRWQMTNEQYYNSTCFVVNSKVKGNQTNYVAIKVFKLKGFSDVSETKGSETSKVKWAIVLKRNQQNVKESQYSLFHKGFPEFQSRICIRMAGYISMESLLPAKSAPLTKIFLACSRHDRAKSYVGSNPWKKGFFFKNELF